jgi:GNAT superfamily N-acetyltransferase
MDEGGVVLVEHGAMFYKLRGDEVWTNALWVHPAHRREGIATQMVKKVAVIGLQEGGVWLCSRTMKKLPEVTAMYQKMGRQIVGQDNDCWLWKDRLEDLVKGWGDGVG